MKYNPEAYRLTVRKLESFYLKDGREWDRIIATDGDDVEMLITNPRLRRVKLGDTLEVTLRVVEDADDA